MVVMVAVDTWDKVSVTVRSSVMFFVSRELAGLSEEKRKGSMKERSTGRR
jgi:hypothetical protein